MIHRISHGPCLGERVSALADGSMAADAATRALAHVAVCADCRRALEVERLTVERLRSLPSPAPSGDLMVALLRLGEPGGPVPLRRRPGPGTPRPATAAVSAPPGRAVAPWAGTTRPGAARRGGRGVQRRAVLAAAGALGAGMLAIGAVGLPGIALPGHSPASPPVDRISVDPNQVHEAVLQQLTRPAGGVGTSVPAVVRPGAMTTWGSTTTVLVRR